MKLVAPDGKRSRRRRRAVEEVRGGVKGKRGADTRSKIGRLVPAGMRARRVEVGVEFGIYGQAPPALAALPEIPAGGAARADAPVQLRDRRLAHVQQVVIA